MFYLAAYHPVYDWRVNTILKDGNFVDGDGWTFTTGQRPVRLSLK